jgi:hypothetical protein
MMAAFHTTLFHAFTQVSKDNANNAAARLRKIHRISSSLNHATRAAQRHTPPRRDLALASV